MTATSVAQRRFLGMISHSEHSKPRTPGGMVTRRLGRPRFSACGYCVQLAYAVALSACTFLGEPEDGAGQRLQVVVEPGAGAGGSGVDARIVVLTSAGTHIAVRAVAGTISIAESPEPATEACVRLPSPPGGGRRAMEILLVHAESEAASVFVDLIQADGDSPTGSSACANGRRLATNVVRIAPRAASGEAGGSGGGAGAASVSTGGDEAGPSGQGGAGDAS